MDCVSHKRSFPSIPYLSFLYSSMSPNHFFVRTEDGKNFKNSKYLIWGTTMANLPQVKHMRQGDVLWFVTAKPYGGVIIAMAEFVDFYDRTQEPLISIHTHTNEEMGWTGDKPWDVQIHYKNLYDIEWKQIPFVLANCHGILEFRNGVKAQILAKYPDLNPDALYTGFKTFCQPTFTVSK
jgi:hypothetical protein